MKQIAVVLSGLLLTSAAGAGDVYVTKDAQGHTIYTDTPLTMPAQKLDVHEANGPADSSQSAPPATRTADQQDPPGSGNEAPQASSQRAAAAPVEDQEKHCSDARNRYQTVMNSRRLYDEGANGERTYLTSEQIDQVRANAKQVMDQFCAGQ